MNKLDCAPETSAPLKYKSKFSLYYGGSCGGNIHQNILRYLKAIIRYDINIE